MSSTEASTSRTAQPVQNAPPQGPPQRNPQGPPAPGGVPPPGGPGGPPPGGPGGPPDGGDGGGGGNNNANQGAQGGIPAPIRLNYDALDTQDGPRALEASGRIVLQINLEDISFWFSELESEMLLAGVGSQWLKLSVLRKNLPIKQREDVKSLLRRQQNESGPHPYLDVKKTLLKLYELKPQDKFKKALGRVLVALPSQLGMQIVDDVCDNVDKLNGCCCKKSVLALWTNQLPAHVNAHISNLEFNYHTYSKVFDAADRVYLSSKTPSVAATQVAASSNPNYSLAAAAENPLNTAMREGMPNMQVAATTARGNRRGRGGRGRGSNRQNQNRNSGQNKPENQTRPESNQQGRRGPRHSSQPPHTCCNNHFTHGDLAWFCQSPSTCPWKDRCTQKP